jgi:hypothetical protein
MSQGTPNFGPQLNQVVQAVRAELQGVTNQHAAWVRQQIDTKYKDIDARLGDMAKIAQALIVSRHEGSIEWPGKGGDGGIRRIEDIPGRRVPFTMTVDIPIGHDTTSVQQQSVTISQDGPFVAVRRIATFMSQYQYSVTNGSAVAKFSGRSFGRYRPIHSAGDLLDAQSNCTMDAGSLMLNDLTQAVPFKPPMTNLILTAFPGFPSSQSNYRSMEFDGRIQVVNAGSSYPRQKDPVPSVFWSQNVSDPYDLAALDFFERGEIITVMVQPNHVNNPPAGNVDGDTIFGSTGAYPYLAGQYDQHEGIAYTQGPNPFPGQLHYDGSTNLVFAAADTIQRLPDGILTIGWEGYRIIQPVGPA